MDKGHGLPYMPWLSLAGLGGPLLFALSQVCVYRDWPHRLASLPILLSLGIGVAFSNTRAVFDGFGNNPGVFERTPKFHLETHKDLWQGNKYALHLDMNIIGELILAVYSAICLALAIHDFPALIPAMAIFTLSFAYVSFTGVLQSWQSRVNRKPYSKHAEG
jgi:hypothetical protein